MKQRYINKIFIFTILLSCFLPLKVLGIAMVTEPIVFKDVLRGTELVDTLTLINSEGRNVTYRILAEGDIADWTTFYKIDDIKLENPITEVFLSPKSKEKVRVKFSIPKDIPNGIYKGKLSIMTEPTESRKENISVGIIQKIEREVSITVSDKEILDFQSNIFPIKYAVKSNEPLKIKVIYTNNGNVAIKPSVQLKIIQLSTNQTLHNAIYPFPENEPPIRPFERRELSSLIEWPTAGQEKGLYEVQIKVLLNGKPYFEKSFRFRVGVDIMELLLASIGRLGGGNILLGWFVLGAIFLFTAAILTILTQNKKIGEKIKILFKNFKINRYL